jgi:hypothetical protein
MNAMLDMLARESSDSGPTETMVVAVIPELDKATDAQKPEGTRPKCRRQVSRLAAHAEEKKKKKRRLRRLSCLDQGAGPSAPVAEKVPAEVFIELIPLVVYLLKLTPMGVIVNQLIPMGVILLRLNPMGVIRLKLTPMGVILHHLLSAFLMRTKKKKKKFH